MAVNMAVNIATTIHLHNPTSDTHSLKELFAISLENGIEKKSAFLRWIIVSLDG